MTEQIRIIDAKEHVNEEVKIGAWLTDKRSSGKIAFLQLRDGSAYFQGVVSKADVPEDVFSLITGQFAIINGQPRLLTIDKQKIQLGWIVFFVKAIPNLPQSLRTTGDLGTVVGIIFLRVGLCLDFF